MKTKNGKLQFIANLAKHVKKAIDKRHKANKRKNANRRNSK